MAIILQYEYCWPTRRRDAETRLTRVAALEAKLDERNAPHLITDTEDELRMRLYHARGALLQHRTSHVMHADSLERPPECHADSSPSRRVAASMVPARASAAFTFFIVGR